MIRSRLVKDRTGSEVERTYETGGEGHVLV
jgi:hypothetical protein